MKKAFVIMILFVLLIGLTACATENNSIKKDLSYFETEIIKIDNKLEKKTALFQVIGATDGYKLSNDDVTIEIYKFDKSSKSYKEAEKNSMYTLVKNGYAIIIHEKSYSNYDKVISMFKELN